MCLCVHTYTPLMSHHGQDSLFLVRTDAGHVLRRHARHHHQQQKVIKPKKKKKCRSPRRRGVTGVSAAGSGDGGDDDYESEPGQKGWTLPCTGMSVALTLTHSLSPSLPEPFSSGNHISTHRQTSHLGDHVTRGDMFYVKEWPSEISMNRAEVIRRGKGQTERNGRHTRVGQSVGIFSSGECVCVCVTRSRSVGRSVSTTLATTNMPR